MISVSNQQTYVQLTHDLMKAKYYRSHTTGSPVKLCAVSKLVYVQMQNRWQYFTKEGKRYYDTQQQVANAVGVERKTAMEIIQNFVEHGIFLKIKEARNNIYTKIYDLEFCDKPIASKKASKSVSMADLYPHQGSEVIVESRAVVEAHGEPVDAVREQIKVYDENVTDLWRSEMIVDVIKDLNHIVRIEKYNNRHVYGQDYFEDYPASPYNEHGQVSVEFKAWLKAKAGGLLCDTYFELDGENFRIPRFYV